MTRCRSAGVLALGLLASGLVGAHATSSPVEATTISEFRIGYRTQINGGVMFAQNSSLTCSPIRSGNAGEDAAGCDEARSGTGRNQNNNAWIMTYVDVDEDPETFNSSSADLAIPEGGRIVYAALYWGAYRQGADGQPGAPERIGTIRLKVPGSNDYVTVEADPADVIAPPASVDGERPYQAKAVVTDLVSAAGAGIYTVADLPAALGSNRYGGWTLATVFEDSSKPLRDITLFDGLSVVRRSARSDVITLSGFRAPVAGPVDATIGIVAYDGDRTSSGDFARFDGVTLASSQSPATNYFNSTIDTFGSLVTSRDPAPVNNFGFDVKVADATGILANGSTSAEIEVGTVGETIYVGLVSTRIDLTAPRFPPVKSVVNLTGHEPAQPGDVLRYRMTVTNKGDDPADAVVVQDRVPAGTTYVDGSVTVDGAVASDSVGDDVADVVDGVVTVRLGTGASPTAGGRVGIGSSATVTFDVTVDEAAEGTTIENTGTLAYRAVTLQRDLDAPTNTVTVPVAAEEPVAPPNPGEAILDVSIVAPERVPAGEVIHYDATVRNTGTAVAATVVLVDALPPGSTLENLSGDCELVSDEIICTVGDLEPGEAWFTQLDLRVAESIEPETRLENVVVATAADVESATASARTRVSGADDLGVSVTVTPPSSSDASALVTVDVVNQASDPTNAVSTLVVLPPGWIAEAGDHGCESDSEVPEVVVCEIGTLGGDGTAEVSVPVRPGPEATSSPGGVSSDTGSQDVVATASSSMLDRDPGDNVASRPLVVAPDPQSPRLPSTGLTFGIAAWAAVALLLGLMAFGQGRRGRASSPSRC